MVKTREKKVVVQGITREQADDAFASYASADARLQQITSRMDTEMVKIREKYQVEIAELMEDKDKSFEILQVYAIENKNELFAKKKSLDTPHGIFGFRLGTPKLKTLKGYTWASVTNLLKEFLPQHVRTVEEVAKDKLLADRENPDVSNLFSKVGIYVDQDETFFVEPKKELAEV